ncbi:hypothetical protein [Pedobacter suwonensis]|uniref:hypothetical protein n=1 Tax=Pedobacter suwonensis TaxID=332999 RepID=UPI0011A7333E|nr:hypothetical protein [Pedobacter suwonensis]
MKLNLILIIAVTFVFYSTSFAQTGQNLYRDAITLYKWKIDSNSQNTKTVGTILQKLRTLKGSSNTANPIIDSLTYLFNTRTFAEEIKKNREKVNEEIMRLLQAKTDAKSTLLSGLKETTKDLKKLNSRLLTLQNLQSSIAGYSPNGATKLSLEVNTEARKNCPDSLDIQDSCFSSQVAIILKRKKEEVQQTIDQVKSELKLKNKSFDNGINLIMRDPKLIEEVGYIKKEAEKKEVTDVLNNYRTGSYASIETQTKEYNINIVNNATQLTNKGMPSQSELIDAFSIYLAKRVKQEAMIYFMQSLRNKLDSARSEWELVKGLNKMLPETSKKLWDWDQMSPPNFDNSWKYAFSKDLISLPKNGIDYLRTNRQIVSDKMLPYLDYLNDGHQVSDKILKHYNFIQMVEYFAAEKEIRDLKSTGMKNFMRLAYIINAEMFKPKDSLNLKSSNTFWISSSDFISNMRNNDDLMRIFVSLLINKYPDLPGFFDKINLYSLKKDEVTMVKNWLGNMLMALQHFQESQVMLKQGDKQNYNINSYWTALSEVIDVALMVNSDKPIINISEPLREGVKQVGNVFEVYQLIQEKNFGAASGSCMSLLSSYLSPGSKSMKETSRIISFISGILQSNSAEQMADVIETFALPPASYRLKQNYYHSITIGAYFGPYAGIEFVKEKQNAAIVGFSAPITLDFNWRSGKNLRSYITASLIMFDLGAVVSYRIKREEGGLPKEVRWSQLFSPGVNLRFGLGNSPLTLSFGGQMNPQLRDFDTGTGNDAIRLSAGLLVDMPLLLVKKRERSFNIKRVAQQPKSK